MLLLQAIIEERQHKQIRNQAGSGHKRNLLFFNPSLDFILGGDEAIKGLEVHMWYLAHKEELSPSRHV